MNKNKVFENNIEEGNNLPSSVMRKCVACGKLFDRKNLIRIMTEYQTGEILINPDNKQFGRSIYMCPNEDCLKLAIKKKRLKKLSESQIDILKDLCS